jgi:hypothetical protein
MQNFSGIYMGRRRRKTGEPEVEMEGSGDDSEPRFLVGITKELKRFFDHLFRLGVNVMYHEYMYLVVQQI